MVLGAAAAAKIAGVPFMKNVKWYHFLVVPLLFGVLVALFRAGGWVFGLVGSVIAVDALIWVVDHVTPMGDGTWPFYTVEVAVMAWDALIGAVLN